uniref:WD repeat domain phosphoinositide-interacting protein 2 n=1 Tax=Macrostomum lignano TaxID=282301 RepID=A0A1I8G8J0_9PLAT
EGPRVLSVSFNQDFTSLAVGLSCGYRLYSLSQNADRLEEVFRHDGDEVCIIERHYSSSLVAMVTQAAPRKLRVCHFKKGTEICSCSYSNSILAVRLNRQRLVVCLEDSLYIHNLQDMKVHIFDTVALKPLCVVAAHDSPLAAISFNAQANKLATASEKGTVIRIFSVPEGQRLLEFRRGVKRCVTVYSLAFSRDSRLLACSSNTETLHVSGSAAVAAAPAEDSWMDWAYKASASYLPAALSQDRDFATARLPDGGGRTLCSLVTIGKHLRLLCAGPDAHLSVFNVNEHVGGDCGPVARLDLRGEPPIPGSAAPAPAAAAAAVPSPATLPSAPSPVQQQQQPTSPPTPPPSLPLPQSSASASASSPTPSNGGRQHRRSNEAAVAETTAAAGRLNLQDSQEFPP